MPAVKKGRTKCNRHANKQVLKSTATKMKRVAEAPTNAPSYGVSYGTLGLRKCTKEEILEAIHECNGKWYMVCQRLQITPATLARYRKEDPELDEIQSYVKGSYVDMTENVLLECALIKKEEWAIKYTLSNWGRDRRWAETTKVQLGGDPDSPPIKTENSVFSLADLDLPKNIMELLYMKMTEKQKEKEAQTQMKQLTDKQE